MDISNRAIGFIGLGAMGSRMAKRLIAAGFKVAVFDRTREKGSSSQRRGPDGAKSTNARYESGRNHLVSVE